jgi:phospholipase/carboxylesterase
VSSEYNVEPRSFIVGFSAGAQFVQDFAFNYPQRVSGVVVLSAGNYYPPAAGARGIPFLVVIGGSDDRAAVAGSEQFVAGLQQSGYQVEYYVLPGVGHTVTNTGKRLTIAFFQQVYGK